MCQLIVHSIGYSGYRNIIISRCRNQQNLMRRRIYDCNDIHITSYGITVIVRIVSVCINSANIHSKWLFSQTVVFCRTSEIKLRFNLVLINDPDLIVVAFNSIFHQFCIRLIVYNCVHFSRNKRLCLFLNRLVFCCGYISDLILNIHNSSFHVLSSGIKLNSELVIGCILQCFCRIIF